MNRSDDMPPVTQSSSLLQSRNRVVAKTFYRQLKHEGFSHEQIIELSTTLLDLVTRDLADGSQES